MNRTIIKIDVGAMSSREADTAVRAFAGLPPKSRFWDFLEYAVIVLAVVALFLPSILALL